MNDPNRLMKWVMIVALVILSLAILYPPHRKLKGGIDLVGGTSLLFEIDTSGLQVAETRDLSSRVMRILKERVDPKGQLNLEWRPVGSTRLEIRMPRPPKEAFERRAAYNEAIDRIQAKNIKRRDLEEALSSPGNDRAAAVDALKRGFPQREGLVAKTVEAYDQLQKIKSGETADGSLTVETASKAYEESMGALLATNLPIGRLTDVLALSSGANRDSQIAKLRNEFATFDGGDMTSTDGKLLTKAIDAYEAWAFNKADLEDPSDLKRRLRGAGVLEFRILAERDRATPTQISDSKEELRQPITRYTEQLAKYGPRPKSGDRYRWFPIEDPLRFTSASDMEEFQKNMNAPGGAIIEEYAGRHYVLMHDSPENRMVKGSGQGGRSWELKSAFPDRNPMTGENVVSFSLNPIGGQVFGELTGGNVGRQLCILLDQQAVSHATIRERITERCQISGRFSPDRVRELVGVLEAGSLPARLKETPLSEETVGPSLGETNRRHGLQASAIGSLLVVLFVLYYYGIAGGGVANLALAVNVLFTLAAMAMMQSTFTLPGIAGVVLSVGMAIDANVLIFERIREERNRGIPLRKALNAGYDRAFSAIFDSNLTTLISCVILGAVASEEVKGFAITLGIGLATSMFTALFCTRLAFNTMIAKGWLEDLHMRKLIGIPKIDWVGLRRKFLPASGVAVTAGVALYLYTSVAKTEQLYDIEFLGGTSLQVDLKPTVTMSDEDVSEAIAATGRAGGRSAVEWLGWAADRLQAANADPGDAPGQYVLKSEGLSGDQLATLMRSTLDPVLERNGVAVSGASATFTTRSGLMTPEAFKEAISKSAQAVRDAAAKLRGARVQSVGEQEPGQSGGRSYEIVTVETNRPVIQQAILAALGDKLAVQRAIRYSAVRDAKLMNEPFFVVEADDHYLSDVIPADAQFDIRRFRGGVVAEVILDEKEEPVSVEAFESRLREVALTPEFEQFRTRETAVFALGAATPTTEQGKAYKRFAVAAIDESHLYEDDPVQWREVLAPSVLAQVDAALSIEKSFAKVVQFAPQIAGQTRNRAMFALVLAMVAIAVYVWMRFGNLDFGLAVLVALFHDVCITLGLVALSHFIYDNPVSKLLLFDDFKVDLSMVAAVLTVIGYSLNDTIVVFDRIRENKGRTGSLSAGLINDSINQTMSRTLLTSLTVFFVVFVLYVFGGKGVHGFGVAMLIGTLSGTYSTIGIAVPLVYKPRILYNISITIAAFGLVGFTLLVVHNAAAQWIISGLILLAAGVMMVRTGRQGDEFQSGQLARV